MLICKGYEQLTPIYDNVSGTSKNKLSEYGHQIFNVFQISQIVSGKGSKCMYLEVRQSLSKGAAQIAPPPVVSILTEEYGI